MDDTLILNRYRPIAQAGAGGFGTVQLAWDTRIQRRVAIKCMRLNESAMPSPVPEALYDAAAIPGLEEARMAAMLVDPNIVGVLDFVAQGGCAYLIMEYVDGMTLSRLLREHGEDVDADVAAALFEGMAHAVEVAHEAGVLHLDVKPDNVIVNRKGQVKVTDFGLSKLALAGVSVHAAGGTIGYMPPEQMRQDPLDVRCDEWALASVAYEVIAGSNPFLAPDLATAQRVIAETEIVLPSLCMDGVGEGADDAIFRALDPDREGRYGSVQEFAADLLPNLGNAKAGRRKLAAVVGGAAEDGLDEGEPPSRAPRLDVASPRLRSAAARAWCALGCGLLAFVGLAGNAWLSGMQTLPFWGVWALVVALACVVPHVGVVLSALTLAAAMASQGAVASGVVLAAASIAWWACVGRRGTACAVAAVSPVLFGGVGLGQATPLVCGFALRARDAAATAAYGAMLAAFLAALGSRSLTYWGPNVYWQHMSLSFEETLLTILQQPATWAIAASWVLAAVVVAAACGRQSRALAVVGMVGAAVVLIAALGLQAGLANGMTSLVPDYSDLAMTLLPVLAMCFVPAIFGVPSREE